MGSQKSRRKSSTPHTFKAYCRDVTLRELETGLGNICVRSSQSRPVNSLKKIEREARGEERPIGRETKARDAAPRHKHGRRRDSSAATVPIG